jgi:predicted O-linked N-acetylglucosamine transferase (SPINDLY family)
VKPGRNDACPCGSGKKYKKCCSNRLEAASAFQPLQQSSHLFQLSKPNQQELGTLVSLFNQQRYVETKLLARSMTNRFPHHGFGWKMLGAALKQIGRSADALVPMQQAATLSPDDPEAHSNLGIVFHDLARLEEAEFSYRRALQINPEFAEAFNNLSITLHALGKYDDSVCTCQRALEIKPDYADAHYNLGNAMQALGKLDDAEASFLRALKIKPDYAQAHSNLGFVLNELGRFDEALGCFQKALEIKPDDIVARSNLLFIFNYRSDLPAAVLLEEARRFGDMAVRRARPYMEWGNLPESGRCLRVGLVSGDLRNHPVGYFLEGVLAALASNASGQIEIIAYSSCFFTDSQTERIKAHCHGWRSVVRFSDESLARQIRDDGIDILIDLSGHTAHNRLPLFAWKPAPVQVSWLGYFATTGVTQMDYLLADEVGVPEDQRDQFTESVWYLPDTRICFTAPRVALPVTQLPALKNDGVTFGCFQNLPKVGDDLLAAWGEIFAALPNAKLRMQCNQLGNSAQSKQMLQRLQRHGIDPIRVKLLGGVSRENYLAAHSEVDMILDTFPYTGGTTTCEALWMGVPTLTLAGDRLLARQGAGLLTAAGMEEWVAVSKDEYIAKAIALASDLPKLYMLRANLRQHVLASPLFDAPRFAHHFEAALRGMWARWCVQQQGRPS